MNGVSPLAAREPLPRPIPAPVVFALALSLCVLWLAAYRIIGRSIREHLHAVAFQGTVALQGVLRESGLPGPERIRKAFEEFEFQGILAIALVRADGQVLAASEEGIFGEEALDMVREALLLGRVSSREAVSSGGRRALRVAMPRPPPPRRPGLGPRWMREAGEGDRPPAMGILVDVDLELGAPLRHWLWAQGIASLVLSLLLEGTRRRARKALEAHQALQQELRRKEVLARLGEMSAVLAHEVRNPLAALKGHLQLLQEEVGSLGKTPRRMQTVLEAVDRLEGLVRDLLESTSDRPADRRWVEMARVVADALELAGEVGGPLLEVRGADLGPVFVDPERLSRMMANLIRNAREAAGPDAPVRWTISQEDEDLVLVVEDGGPGLAREDQERAFQPFVTGKARGTGLGLFIARRVAEAHGGSLTAGVSRDLGGARFEARIPKE